MSEAPIGQSEQNESGDGECVKYMKQCLTKHDDASCGECVGMGGERGGRWPPGDCPDGIEDEPWDARSRACSKARSELVQ